MESENNTNTSWLDRSLSSILPHWNVETLMVILVLVIAVISRFYHVDLRVMSHDEVNHVVPSWDLFQGSGYRHDPVTHGPMQFHLVALSYFMMGDNDFSARVPAVLFSIATVAFVLFGYRRYLGRSGALVAGFLFLISPFMLFYGRYTRNEAFVALFGVVMIYSVLRYLDKGDHISLYLLAASTVLHYCTKETSYIYTAQMLLFLGFLFLDSVNRAVWPDEATRKRFIVLVLVAFLLFGTALTLGALNSESSIAATPTLPSPVAGEAQGNIAGQEFKYGILASLAGALVVAALGLVLMVRSLGWDQIRSMRPFDLLMLLGTLILPLLTAFPVKLVGWDPLDYSTTGMLRTGIFLVLLFLVAAGLGWWWNRRLWPIIATMFYGVFVILYTTFFTNGQGFFTGIIGSLGYWLSQQGVERGSQPWYYYALIQMPVYEYLAILGTCLAVFFGIRKKAFSTPPGASMVNQPAEINSQEKLPTLALLVFWAVTGLVAYSVAGEKMPWLTVHVTLGFLLAAGWGIGYLIDHIHWSDILNHRGIIAVVLMPAFLASVVGILGSVLGNQPPFQGKTLEQLQATSTFLLAFITAVGSGGGIIWLLAGWQVKQIASLLGIVFFTLVSILTARTAAMASYINYDTPLEYMVYAHAARGPKDVLEQVEEISRRLTRGKDIVVAYDNDGLYPYWWYFRDYPNHRWFTDKPTRDLRDAPLIISGDATMGKMAPIIQDNYLEFEYMRLWWPNQDYWDLTWERIWNAVSNPEMRMAIFDIWLNRDYSQYAKLTNNQTLTLENWQPSARMKFYIRKDVAAQMWNYGAVPAAPVAEVETDPYREKITWFVPDLTFGVSGTLPGQFQAPRGIVIAPDGSLYVADSRNHRIQHFTAEGDLLQSWGTFADAASGAASGSTFNEPWGVAVGPDGTVYVTDTWNHRVQKFSADGQFLTMWGYFGQAEAPDAFWGPRGVAVDKNGRVYVMDTGNKRVVVFGPDQKFITQFGTAGLELGQFDEPVGIALDQDGNVYITDTWNQRIQVFASNPEGTEFTLKTSWDIYGWFGQSLDNKPFITVAPSGEVYVTDPEGYRILVFDSEGNFLRGWGDYSAGTDGFGMPAGVAVDEQGRVWVSDAANNILMRFIMP